MPPAGCNRCGGPCCLDSTAGHRDGSAERGGPSQRYCHVMDNQGGARGREREGAIIGVLGLLIALFGLAGSPPAIVLGLVVAVIGAIMWGAGMAARRD
jgi:hypothetical protein